jgi:hypothetical protein
MVDIKTLLPELKRLVTELSEDLLARSTTNAEIDAGLRNAYTQIEKGGRTADAFEVWTKDYLDQVAVAWVLSCVFIRYMEDNHLVDECWIAGEGDRRRYAEDSYELYFRENPLESDREYFQHIFREVGCIPACTDLFAVGKSPIWAIGPSGDAAIRLLAYWREIDTDTGQLKRRFNVENGDTRFLGDLYQDLSLRARERYALLQTPEYVETFILDRTLRPAIDEIGLDAVRLIDPTCGSGHFLLGSFSRLFHLWRKRVDNDIVAAQKAFDGVWGVDINPFAVAIARFRLIVAALKACEIRRLKAAPAWKINLAIGDSLLFGSRWERNGEKTAEQQFFNTEKESWAPEIYACEDQEAITEVLGQQYHVVVGNPPYIRSFDSARNDAYRKRFSKSTSGKFTLTIPFFERFFELCLGTDKVGYTGFITSGEFMKADFGKKLVKELVPNLELTHVIDTANVPLEGHGTNTIIVFGRNRKSDADVRLVQGIKGESPPPVVHSESRVWHAIVSMLDVADYEDEFISVSDEPKETFCQHPWNITGGGATKVRDLIESASGKTLKQIVADVGVGFVTGKDKVFEVPKHVAIRNGVSEEDVVSILNGEDFRDWVWVRQSHAVFPFRRASQGGVFKPQLCESSKKFLWRFRTSLWNRLWFKQTQKQRGLEWWQFGHISNQKADSPESIFWGEISTHNHFGFDETGLMGDQTAPMIKFKQPFDAVEAFGLLAILNSSVGCLWLKQVCRAKGGDHVGSKGARVRKNLWDERYAFASRKVSNFPIPDVLPDLGRQAHEASRSVYEETFGALSEGVVPTDELLKRARQSFEDGVALLRAIQEEIDWQCYGIYGLMDSTGTTHKNPPSLLPGQRSFELELARQSKEGEALHTWFTRHAIEPVFEIPSDWPDDYANTVRSRLEAIASNDTIRLLESPIYKRRWNLDSWAEIEERVLREWLLGRIEQTVFRISGDVYSLLSVAAIADLLNADSDFVSVAGLYRKRNDFDFVELVSECIADSAVPILPVETYTQSGQIKLRVWESVWEMQRQEDRGMDIVEFPAPPEFSKNDFQSEVSWKLRKEMNVPMERFLAFPNASRDGDPTLVVGWAGWNHLQRATAIVAYYDSRKREGWPAERLTPLLAALDQLLPWIHQWHPEIDPEYNETAGTSFQTLLESEAQELGLTLEQIRKWTPPAKAKGGKKKAEGGSKPRKTRKKKADEEAEAEE